MERHPGFGDVFLLKGLVRAVGGVHSAESAREYRTQVDQLYVTPPIACGHLLPKSTTEDVHPHREHYDPG